MNNETFSETAIRHGEMVIVPVDSLPDDIEEAYTGKDHIIGHSGTGHHHVLTGDAVVYKPLSPAYGGATYKRLCGQLFGSDESLWPDELVPFEARTDGKIVHQKTFDVHAPLDVLKGLYVKFTKRQFNYFTGLLERVRD